MKLKRKPLLAAVLVAALPAMAGCSSAHSTAPAANARGVVAATGTASPAATPSSGLTQGMALPLEAYEETYPESQTILQAQFILEGRCMSQYGFSFTPTIDTDATGVPYDASNMARRYGLADLATAQTQGYQLPQTGADAPPQPDLSQAENYVLTGSKTPGAPAPVGSTSPGQYAGKSIPSGGCATQARNKIGSFPSNLLADQFDAQSLTASQGTTTVITAIAKWSACMKQHGFTVSSPYNASELSAQAGAAPGSALDKTIAVDDVDCKQTTNLIPTWFGEETKLQNQYISANQLALNDQQAAIQTAVKNAEAIITQ